MTIALHLFGENIEVAAAKYAVYKIYRHPGTCC